MPAKYEWRTWRVDGETFHGLLPHDEPNNHALTRIAYIYRSPCQDQWIGSYYFPHSTGNKDGRGSAWLKTAIGCKRWVEREFDKFWEPPVIGNAVT